MRYSILLFISFAFSVSGAAISKDIDDGEGNIVNIIVNINHGNDTEMKDTANANGATTLEPATTKVYCPDEEYLVGNACVAKMDSKIIETDQMHTNLTSLIDIGTKSLNLLWRGTRDGFGADVFHTKCDGKANTLTIVKSTFGFVFGGYTSVAWASSGGYKTDISAYLFSLTNPMNEPRKWNVTGGGQHAVWHYNGYGPEFGDDLCIRDNSNGGNISPTSSSMYDCPDELNGDENGGTWYHGDTIRTFQTVEVEVFQVV